MRAGTHGVCTRPFAKAAAAAAVDNKFVILGTNSQRLGGNERACGGGGGDLFPTRAVPSLPPGPLGAHRFSAPEPLWPKNSV